MSSKKSRAKKRARQNGRGGGIQSYAINLGGQTSVVERGSKAERDLLSRGGVAGTEADKTNRGSYLKSLNNPSSPNYVNQDAFGSTITGDSLKQELPIPLPEQPKPINYNGMVSGAISSVGGVNGVIPPVDTTPIATSDAQTQADKLKSLLGVYSEPISQSDIYAQAEKEAQTQKYTKRVNRYQNQLNAITAKSQADQLSVTGQGRGIPEAIIGGQQAQISKEAAIASLPVAAQLSAAQGDLEIAQSHLDNLFKIRSADAQANADYRDKLAQLTYNFFDKAEKAQLDKLDATTQDNKSRRTDATNFAQSIMTKLINDGNVSGASVIAGLEQPDPTSKTFEQDLINYNRKVTQYSGGVGGSGVASAKSSEVLANVSLIDDLLGGGQLENVVGINRLNPFNYIPGTQVQYAKNQFNQIKSILSLENRQKLKGSGAISDFEARTLGSAASSLGTNLDNASALKELKKIRGAFANAAGLPSLVKITDPSTGRSVVVNADRSVVNQAIIDGATVEYQ